MGPKISSESLEESADEGMIALTSRCSCDGWAFVGEGAFSGDLSTCGRRSECFDRCRLAGGGTSGERDRLRWRGGTSPGDNERLGCLCLCL